MDADIIQLAVKKEAYILTEDKDFVDENIFRKSIHFGAILLRLHGVSIEEKKTTCSNGFKQTFRRITKCFLSFK